MTAQTFTPCANGCRDTGGNRKAAATFLPDGKTAVCGACAQVAWLTPAELRAIVPTFTPTEESVLRALRPQGRLVPRVEVISSVWGVGPEDQGGHELHALRVNLSRMKPKLAARGQEIVAEGWRGLRLVAAEAGR